MVKKVWESINNTMRWIEIDTLPKTKGKYVVRTVSIFSKEVSKFGSYFNGSSFNVSNQIVTHWLDEIPPLEDISSLSLENETGKMVSRKFKKLLLCMK